ncbi:MAG: efflux RND transporter periplasmic adaptor subunit [Acidobacteriota bacterium]
MSSVPSPRFSAPARQRVRWANVLAALALLVAGLGLSACGGSSDARTRDANARPAAQQAGGDGAPARRGAQQAEGVLVRVMPIVQDEMTALYTTSATLRAAQRATVTTRTRGVLRALEVEEGDSVREGDVLAALENEEQTIAFARTRDALDLAQAEFQRTERLYQQELISRDAFDTVQRTLREAEHAAELAALELSRTTIRAPFAGVVLTRHLDVGNTVADGTAVYDLADNRNLLADVNVPERHIATLRADQVVRLTVDATERVVDARIARLAPAVDPETGTVKVTVEVPANAGLRPGSFVRVAIVTDVHPEALVIPRSALVAEGRRWTLYRVSADGTQAEQLEVTLGFEDGARVEIMPEAVYGQQLAIGERVVTAGAGSLSDGAAIQIDADADAPTDAVADDAAAETAAAAQS